MAEQWTIAEDPRLAQRIRQAAGRGALSHAVILSGQGDLLEAARFTAAAMECEGADRPCGQCAACRKIRRDIHPDVRTVEDPEHKSISMEVLRQVRSDAYIVPNEGRRKIYLFPDCDKLDPKTQNVLLKVLEEGPPHASFVFCAANSAALLQTIRSRAVEWKLAPAAQPTGEDAGARRLCELLCEGRAADITAFCADLESGKLGREELRQLLGAARDLVCRALAASCGLSGEDPLCDRMARQMGRHRLSAAADTLEAFARQCSFNIGVGHLTGALAVELTK